MTPKSTKNLLREFRNSRGQFEEPTKVQETPKRKKSTSSTSYYDMFIRKYNDLEKNIDNLGTRDIVYYFRQIAEEQGYKYVISNIKKDMAIAKRLRSNFTNGEICAMIEFLFESDQDYLDKNGLSLNILGSSWINTIYADMKLWVEDKYIPKSVKSKQKKNIKQREWDKEVANTEDDVKIGVKL